MSFIEPFSNFLGYGDFSDVFLENSAGLSIRWEDGAVQSISRLKDAGMGWRILNGKETRFVSTNLIDPLNGSLAPSEKNKLIQFKKDLIQGLSHSPSPHFSPPIEKKHPVKDDPLIHSLDEKISILSRIFEKVKNGRDVQQVNVNYGEKTKRIGYLNSEGMAFKEERTYLVFSLMITVGNGNDLQTAYESMGGISGFELFDLKKMDDMAEVVLERAQKKLKASPAPAGEMPVIIASSAGGTLIHEAVGHSLEADAVLEGTSPAYMGKLGQVVGNKKLTVLDNPTVPGARGSFYFDDEGVPAEKSILIENGVLKDYMFDRKSALRANRKSNGHGRRESFQHRPIPRMSNTYVLPGPDNPDEILDSMKDGFLVTKMGGGQVNPATGDFVFDVEEGFQIKKGKKNMVRSATLLGNGPAVLNQMDMIGTDHGWAIGTCGKEGQGAPVSDALPTVHIKKLVIGG